MQSNVESRQDNFGAFLKFKGDNMTQDNQEQSDVEKFFYTVQNKMHGNLLWQDLNQHQQIMFTQAVNIILQTASGIKQ